MPDAKNYRRFLDSRSALIVLLSMLSMVCTARADAPKHLVIIAPQQFCPALAAYVKHKSAQLPTELVSLETVLKTQGVDDPEKVKRYLYQQWRENSVGYALLVGDADVFPVRYIATDRKSEAAFNYAFYPSDLYYSDLAKTEDGSFDDWNGNKDDFHRGYFGEVRGEKNKNDPMNYDHIDYRPDIAVGRWPVSTVEEVGIVTKKTMAYEAQLAAGNNKVVGRVGFVAVGEWVDGRPFSDAQIAKLGGGWDVNRLYYSDAGRNDHTSPPDESHVIQMLNDGEGLIIHTGHGSDTSWYKCFKLPHLNQVKNADHLPVMISAGCSTARFATLPPYEPYVDVNGTMHEGTGTEGHEVFTSPPPAPGAYQSGRCNPPGLGEQLLRGGPDGAVAYIGCNTGSQPCAITLVEGFVTKMKSTDHPLLGDCWSGAVSYYYDKEHLATLKPTAEWYPPVIFFQAMKYMVYGDPSLPMAVPPVSKSS